MSRVIASDGVTRRAACKGSTWKFTFLTRLSFWIDTFIDETHWHQQVVWVKQICDKCQYYRDSVPDTWTDDKVFLQIFKASLVYFMRENKWISINRLAKCWQLAKLLCSVAWNVLSQQCSPFSNICLGTPGYPEAGGEELDDNFYCS